MLKPAQLRFFPGVALLASAVLLLVPVASQAQSARSHNVRGADRPKLQQRLDAVVAAGAPGVVALVNDGGRGWRNGHDIWLGVSGLADVSTGRPMDPTDRFRVGSVTKTFVATVALQLVREHKLSLEDTVEHWLPGILPYANQVTVRNLLNHTSGVPEYIVAPLLEIYFGNRFRSWKPSEVVVVVAGQPQLFPAGTRVSYSNTDYVLIGMIIEKATRNDLGSELKRRIFRPLQLKDTSFPGNDPVIPAPFARGYSLARDDRLRPIEGQLFDFTLINPSPAWAAGGIISSVTDLARFFHALLGGRLLPPALLAEMKATRPGATPDARYGLGLVEISTPCGPLLGHDGGFPGFSNSFFSSEDGKHQVALMINANAAPETVSPAFNLALNQAVREAFNGKSPCA